MAEADDRFVTVNEHYRVPREPLNWPSVDEEEAELASAAAGPGEDVRAKAREQVARIVYDRDAFEGDLPWSRTHPNEQERCRRIADAVLAVPSIADALAAAEAVRRVEALHHEAYSGWCKHCADISEGDDEALWPCATIRALSGD